MATTGAENHPSAEHLLSLAQSDPRRVISLTDSPISGPPSIESSAALRARGVALRILDRNGEALDALTSALTEAEAIGDGDLTAECLRSLAPVIASAGDVDRAFDTLDDAERFGGHQHRPHIEFQRAGLALLVADWRRSHLHYTRALDLYRGSQDITWIGATLLGRGLTAAYIGNRDQADADLVEAQHRFAEVDDEIGVGQAIWNHALALSVLGEPARAVVMFDQAAQRLEATGFPVDLFLTDQAEALFAVGLHEEAVELATRCVDAYADEASGSSGLARQRSVLDGASRRLELARIHRLTDQLDDATHHAAIARRDFEAQGQTLRAIFAELVELDCRARSGHHPGVAERAGELHRLLAGHRQPEWRCEARLIQARCALAAGNTSLTRRRLAQITRIDRSLLQELARLELSARVALGAGDTGGALRFARRARRTVKAGPRLTGSSWVEAALTRQLESIAELGLGVLLRSGAAGKALQFATELEVASDAQLRTELSAELLTEYRALTRAIETAANEFRETAPIERRRDSLARKIRAARTTVAANPTTRPEAALGAERNAGHHGIAIARWFITDDGLWLVSGHRRLRADLLGPARAAIDALDELAFSLRRAFRSPDERRLESLAASAEAADALLGEPGGAVLNADGPLHLMPAPQLPPIVFGLLPSLRSKSWVQLESLAGQIAEPREPRRINLVGGPGLEHAEQEVATLAAQHQGPVAAEPIATCRQAIELLESCDLFHVAAHSRLNAGNPMFSSIQLADGEVVLHELEGLDRVPSVALMASCESARGDRVGLTRVGIASALLAAGIDVVIGTALAIPDTADTVALMSELHRTIDTAGPIAAVGELDRSMLSPMADLIASTLVPCIRAPLRNHASSK